MQQKFSQRVFRPPLEKWDCFQELYIII